MRIREEIKAKLGEDQSEKETGTTYLF